MAKKERTQGELAALALYYHAAEMVKEGKTQDEIIQQLMQQGISAETARMMLDRIEESRDNVTRRYGWRNAALGALLVVLALALIFGVTGDPVRGIGLAIAVVVLLAGGYSLVRGLMQLTGL